MVVAASLRPQVSPVQVRIAAGSTDDFDMRRS
jgi:hypothetical protein